jgi:hypothetical protein
MQPLLRHLVYSNHIAKTQEREFRMQRNRL